MSSLVKDKSTGTNQKKIPLSIIIFKIGTFAEETHLSWEIFAFFFKSSNKSPKKFLSLSKELGTTTIAFFKKLHLYHHLLNKHLNNMIRKWTIKPRIYRHFLLGLHYFLPPSKKIYLMRPFSHYKGKLVDNLFLSIFLIFIL